MTRLTRIRIDLEHPAHGRLRLNFVDQRIFGSMAIDELIPTPGCLAGQPRSRAASPTSRATRSIPHFDDAVFLAGWPDGTPA